MDFQQFKEKLGPAGATVGGSFLGFAAGFTGNNLYKKSQAKDLPLMVNLPLALGIGLGIPAALLKEDQNFLKGLCYGAAVYFTVKSINQAIDSTGLFGLGDATVDNSGAAKKFLLPDGVRNFLRKYVPTLSGTDDFPQFSYYNRGSLDLPVLGNNGGYDMPSMGNISYDALPGSQLSLTGIADQYVPTAAQRAML